MSVIFHRINTLARLSSVWHQTDTVELDVTAVQGGLIVAHHKDYGLDLAALEQMSWHAVLEMNPHIPLFREYLAIAAHAGVGMFVEAKGSTAEMAARVVEEIIIAIAEQRIAGLFTTHPDYPQTQIILHGFSIEGLRHAQDIMKTVNEKIHIGLGWTSSPQYAKENAGTATELTHVESVSGYSMDKIQQMSVAEWNLQGVAICKHYGFEILCVHKSGVTKELTDAAHAAELKLFAFVGTEQEDIDYLTALRTDRIICEPSALYGKF
jgi:glycerophosphoryl diester phosphodiesterase